MVFFDAANLTQFRSHGLIDAIIVAMVLSLHVTANWSRGGVVKKWLQKRRKHGGGCTRRQEKRFWELFFGGSFEGFGELNGAPFAATL